MRESDCQREFSTTTETPKEVYRVAFSYERGDRAYKLFTERPVSQRHLLVLNRNRSEIFGEEQAALEALSEVNVEPDREN